MPLTTRSFLGLDDEDGDAENWEIGGISLGGVHSGLLCVHRACVIHGPSDHHMADWELRWRNDRGLFERICSHGIGHPDPDQFEYWRETDQEWQSVHGCCGCCARP